MNITFDPAKRQANLAKHGIDFADCETVFDYPMLSTEDDRAAYGEQRIRSLGLLAGRVVMLVWTARDDDCAHLITCRFATKHETRTYLQEAFA